MAKADAVSNYIDGFREFVEEAHTSFHAAAAISSRLAAAGFRELDENDIWEGEVASGFVRRGGAVIAWKGGEAGGKTAHAPFRILGSHTDSPGFRVKPAPEFEREGVAQLGVEIYGGPLLNSWLDRDLAVAGRVFTADGREELVCTGPVARIPQLAIHLDRGVNEKLKLGRQQHTQPVTGMGEGQVMALIAEAIGVSASEITGSDLFLVDTQMPERIGTAREFFASKRLDNLSSTYAGLHALLETDVAPGAIAVLAAFDHEEVGSESRTGAAGPLLEDVLGRLHSLAGADAQERTVSLANSWCISADAGHAVHPNYPEVHDPNVRPRLGDGLLLKVNAQQRYTSDGEGEAFWNGLLKRTGVNGQEFVSNNDIPCGSTIGPLSATRLGIRTVDVGVPLLSMHSAREMAHVRDLHDLARVVATFYGEV